MSISNKIKNYLKQRNSIQDDCGSGWVNKLKLNGISIEKRNVYESFYIVNGVIEEEAKDYVFEDKGGIIIFSTDVNVNKGGIKSFISNKLKTLSNRIFKSSKVNNVIKKHKEVFGVSLGNFFKGRYKAKDGSVYDEKSLSLEIIGITSETLEKVASNICREFDQESVLVKDYESGEIYLANKS